MIESILLAALGFLGAVLLALLVAPVLWRRAVILTRRRVEASIPISRDEIQADKDRLRAEFAMAARRLEIEVKSFRDRTNSQSIELDRERDKVRDLTNDLTAREERIAALAKEAEEREAELHRHTSELQAVSARAGEIETRMDETSREFEEMSRLYEDASYASSTRQIELVAREAEIDRLSDELSGLRKEGKEAERRMREAETGRKAGEEAVDAERRRAEELDARLSRLMTTISDREERLERREKEMARLQQEARRQSERAEELARKFEAEQATRARLEEALDRSAAEIAALERHEKEVVRLQRDLLAQTKRADGLARQLEARQAVNGINVDAAAQATVAAAGVGMQSEPPAETASPERETLEKRITALARENRKLRTGARVAPQSDEEARAKDALLRDQINELAAQVVQLTSLVDGPESPLRKQFANGNGGDDGANGMSVTSIADRVRALQKAAASRVN